ncbi:hypothetical protein C8Q76DRAFT_822246 [Earliella scabrosa]|nr:hypothetical protein C8Q76DRAFT_822246 [Earliella scabrosa]
MGWIHPFVLWLSTNDIGTFLLAINLGMLTVTAGIGLFHSFLLVMVLLKLDTHGPHGHSTHTSDIGLTFKLDHSQLARLIYACFLSAWTAARLTYRTIRRVFFAISIVFEASCLFVVSIWSTVGAIVHLAIYLASFVPFVAEVCVCIAIATNEWLLALTCATILVTRFTARLLSHAGRFVRLPLWRAANMAWVTICIVVRHLVACLPILACIVLDVLKVSAVSVDSLWSMSLKYGEAMAWEQLMVYGIEALALVHAQRYSQSYRHAEPFSTVPSYQDGPVISTLTYPVRLPLCHDVPESGAVVAHRAHPSTVTQVRPIRYVHVLLTVDLEEFLALFLLDKPRVNVRVYGTFLRIDYVSLSSHIVIGKVYLNVRIVVQKGSEASIANPSNDQHLPPCPHHSSSTVVAVNRPHPWTTTKVLLPATFVGCPTSVHPTYLPLYNDVHSGAVVARRLHRSIVTRVLPIHYMHVLLIVNLEEFLALFVLDKRRSMVFVYGTLLRVDYVTLSSHVIIGKVYLNVHIVVQKGFEASIANPSNDQHLLPPCPLQSGSTVVAVYRPHQQVTTKAPRPVASIEARQLPAPKVPLLLTYEPFVPTGLLVHVTSWSMAPLLSTYEFSRDLVEVETEDDHTTIDVLDTTYTEGDSTLLDATLDESDITLYDIPAFQDQPSNVGSMNMTSVLDDDPEILPSLKSSHTFHTIQQLKASIAEHHKWGEPIFALDFTPDATFNVEVDASPEASFIDVLPSATPVVPDALPITTPAPVGAAASSTSANPSSYTSVVISPVNLSVLAQQAPAAHHEQAKAPGPERQPRRGSRGSTPAQQRKILREAFMALVDMVEGVLELEEELVLDSTGLPLRRVLDDDTLAELSRAIRCAIDVGEDGLLRKRKCRRSKTRTERAFLDLVTMVEELLDLDYEVRRVPPPPSPELGCSTPVVTSPSSMPAISVLESVTPTSSASVPAASAPSSTASEPQPPPSSSDAGPTTPDASSSSPSSSSSAPSDPVAAEKVQQPDFESKNRDDPNPESVDPQTTQALPTPIPVSHSSLGSSSSAEKARDESAPSSEDIVEQQGDSSTSVPDEAEVPDEPQQGGTVRRRRGPKPHWVWKRERENKRRARAQAQQDQS